jgi:ABC-2 type transport system permease protein
VTTVLRNPFTKWLWDNRRSILGWAVAVVGVGSMYAAFWPSMDNPTMRQAIESYPESIMKAMNFTDLTAAGYLSATVFGMIVATLLVVHGVMVGTRLVAGDEEAGLLDLVLAHPISRARLGVQRFAAYAVSVVVIVVGLLLVVEVLAAAVGFAGVGFGGLAAISVHLLCFGVLFGAVGYAVGAATGRRSLAIGTGSGLAVFGFAANGVLPQVSGLAWTQNLSAYYWLTGEAPIVTGVQWGHLLLMVGLVAVLVAGGTWAFTRRDIAV